MANFKKQKIKWIFIVFVALFLSLGCTEDPLNDNLEFEISPESPTVFIVPKKEDIAGEEVELAPPWFRAVVSITNNSEQTLAVVGIRFRSDPPGSTAPKSGAFFGYEANDVPSEFVAILDPGESYTTPADLFFDDIGGLADDPTNQKFNYRVRIDIVGWFSESTGDGARTNAGTRVNKSLVFVTQ